MNRLWVRLSITFGVVIWAVIFTIGLSFRMPVDDGGTPPLPFEELTLSPAEREAIQTLIDSDFFSRLAEQTSQQFPAALIYIIVVTGIAAVMAGIWMSRRLTTPLDTLQQAAQTIGTSNFSHRVQVKGTDEIVNLAHAFNSMAAQLAEAEALRSNLLADVAHELRNPLHVIEGNLRAILDEVYPLNLEEVGHLLDQTQHLTRLVNDLHELAQAEAHQLTLHKQKTDMATLVKETAVSFKPSAAAQNISLQTQLLGPIPELSVDAARIRQAISNLLSNALQYTSAEGYIIVTAESQKGEFAIRVQDSGAGIAAEHLNHVFDRFYRSDNARSRDKGGTGLGLAIVKAIIEEHGGHVMVESDGFGKGSTFTLYLPTTDISTRI